MLLTTLFSAFACLLSLFLLALLFELPGFKRVVGLIRMHISTRWLLDKNSYHQLKHVKLLLDDGSEVAVQIVVSRYGLFIIEVKSMYGWIFGSEYQQTWFRQVYTSRDEFENPLIQNYRFKKMLQRQLGLEPAQVFSAVVFPYYGISFKTLMPENVLSGRSYARYIKSHTLQLFTEQEVKNLVEEIESGRIHIPFSAAQATLERPRPEWDRDMQLRTVI